MKSLSIFLFLLTSCSYYNQEVSVSVGGLSPGVLSISTIGSSETVIITDQKICQFTISKGEVYFVELQPLFYTLNSRFSYGAIVSSEDTDVTISSKLGVLSQVGTWIYNEGYSIEIENIYELKEKLNSVIDPWIYNVLDIKYYLLGDITIGSISKKRKYVIPELDLYKDWEPENSLFYTWYESVQCFYNSTNNQFYRVEIYEDGSFCGFDEVK
ncbi:MAG: hypothetical protein OCD02_19200 [Spirochaetaceae bacterium]